MLCSKTSERIITSDEERLRALQHVCLAIPRTAQALQEEVRQAGRRAVPRTCAARGSAALPGGA